MLFRPPMGSCSVSPALPSVWSALMPLLAKAAMEILRDPTFRDCSVCPTAPQATIPFRPLSSACLVELTACSALTARFASSAQEPFCWKGPARLTVLWNTILVWPTPANCVFRPVWPATTQPTVSLAFLLSSSTSHTVSRGALPTLGQSLLPTYVIQLVLNRILPIQPTKPVFRGALSTTLRAESAWTSAVEEIWPTPVWGVKIAWVKGAGLA